MDVQTAEVYITHNKKLKGHKDVGKVQWVNSFILQMKDYNYILK